MASNGKRGNGTERRKAVRPFEPLPDVERLHKGRTATPYTPPRDPYFIQEYGLELWNQRRGPPIRADEVDAVREIVTDTLARNFFGTRFQLATDAEQLYLAAMASIGDPPYRSAKIARRDGARDQRGVSVHRDSLIQEGLIWSPRRGQVDFTVPPFAEYLRDNHPIASFDDE